MQITRIFIVVLVETAKRYFIFDYYKRRIAEIKSKDKPVYVFLAMDIKDHYEPKYLNF